MIYLGLHTCVDPDCPLDGQDLWLLEEEDDDISTEVNWGCVVVILGTFLFWAGVATLGILWVW
jgi:hypothetical protein